MFHWITLLFRWGIFINLQKNFFLKYLAAVMVLGVTSAFGTGPVEDKVKKTTQGFLC